MDTTLCWISRKLDDLGWSQGELSRRAKISTATISRVLSGKEKPSLKFYAGISRALSIPLPEVVRMSHGSVTADDLDQLAELANELDNESRKMLLEFAMFLYQRGSNSDESVT